MRVRVLCRVLLTATCVLFLPLVLLHRQLPSINQADDGGIRKGPNLLVEHFTNESTISYHGWWMGHARWSVASSCDDLQHSKCPHAYSVQCKMDGIKSLHQFNVLSPEKKISGFVFSALYSAQNMETTAELVESFIGVLVLIKLQGPGVIQKRTPLLDYDGEVTEIIELDVDVVVITVTVSLCCVGVEGVVKFWSVELRPINSAATGIMQQREDYIIHCPKSLLPPHPPQHTYSEEVILTPTGELPTVSMVTLVVQMTVDRIDMLSLNGAVWDGPMSIVLYFPVKSSTDNDHVWKRKYIKKKLNQFTLNPHTYLTVVYARSNTDSYPINALRNLAMKHVYTDYMLLMDGDFMVSPHFEKSFQLAQSQISSLSLDHVAYVVPVFELVAEKWSPEQRITPSLTKQDLISRVTQEDADILPFRSLASPLAHYSTNYSHWYLTSTPYLVTDYRDKYEPYLVLRKDIDLPQFCEWFEGYGMNKVTHVMELWAAGYQFVVLPDNWAIHVPHVETKYSKQFLIDLDKRIKNRILRFEFITYLIAKYQLDQCKVTGTK
ncbi:xylosyl- and glucuronyltransferase LARGE2s-like isoform X3 [Dysidea avara]|uniref:xylosyl- and glucuronyltransferase LARGE2s-like isoform X3 n=1 Tax=Dysidea avara TaxID=196820 RepID=UPI0033175FEB